MSLCIIFIFKESSSLIIPDYVLMFISVNSKGELIEKFRRVRDLHICDVSHLILLLKFYKLGGKFDAQFYKDL